MDDNDEPVPQWRKVLFKDLIELPKRERSKQPREKVFTSHYLSCPENQEIIRNADKVTKRKEELAKAKTEAYKKFSQEEKESKKKQMVRKKKVTVRSDKVKARSLPVAVRGRGRSMSNF